jgi:hypothetical protein
MGKCSGSVTLLPSSLWVESNEVIERSRKGTACLLISSTNVIPCGSARSLMISIRWSPILAQVCCNLLPSNFDRPICYEHGTDDLEITGGRATALNRDKLCLVLANLVDTSQHSRSTEYLRPRNDDMEMAGERADVLGRDKLCLVLANLVDTTEHSRSTEHLRLGNDDLETAGVERRHSATVADMEKVQQLGKEQSV